MPRKLAEREPLSFWDYPKLELYRWREKYLTSRKKGEEFKLYSRDTKPTRFFPPEVEKFLHEELYYIARCEGRFKNRFNFSFLAEQAEKKFDRPFNRNSIRRFALRNNYYHQDSKEKKKVGIRFVKHKGIHVTYTVGEDEGKIQFKRTLESLGIGVIYAQSPEAKGKIEKQFDYFQRRLPFLCQRYKVVKISEAEKILDELISFYNERHRHEETGEIPNERWKEEVRGEKSRLRILSEEIDLDYVFSFHFGHFLYLLHQRPCSIYRYERSRPLSFNLFSSQFSSSVPSLFFLHQTSLEHFSNTAPYPEKRQSRGFSYFFQSSR